MRVRLLTMGLLLPVLAATGCQPGPVDTASAAPPIAAPPAGQTPVAMEDDLVAHGEYIVRIAGCNDCHTPGYAESGGELPTDAWLTGSPLGYHGPWGTTYASNLRLTIAGLDEAEWLAYTANLHTRPIMPDFVLRQMREHDRRAIHRFVRSLGPTGTPARPALPPGEAPPPPYFQLVLPAAAAQAAAAPHQGQPPVQ